ncbi:MAG TPA: tetratricopeptide repeat protein [Nitrospira sp.]|jgi:Flp pilus assembly protein TadD|nr:tetratricopeptide repeat protein [Nitrospira sp.]
MNLDAFRQMVAKNPKGFLGRYGLGNKILEENGSLEEAVEHLTVATQLDPTHAASHLALGRALARLGKRVEAKPILTAGIEAVLSGRSNGGKDLVPEMQELLRSL